MYIYRHIYIYLDIDRYIYRYSHILYICYIHIYMHIYIYIYVCVYIYINVCPLLNCLLPWMSRWGSGTCVFRRAGRGGGWLAIWGTRGGCGCRGSSFRQTAAPGWRLGGWSRLTPRAAGCSSSKLCWLLVRERPQGMEVQGRRVEALGMRASSMRRSASMGGPRCPPSLSLSFSVCISFSLSLSLSLSMCVSMNPVLRQTLDLTQINPLSPRMTRPASVRSK